MCGNGLANHEERSNSLSARANLGALYYPYIHIWDVNWLRANLILFPKIERMIPMDYTPRDDPGVAEFARVSSSGDALLKVARIFSDRCIKAQNALIEKFEEDSREKAFLGAYGKESARKLVDRHDYGFQIHTRKLKQALRDVLCKNGLAWEPVNLEPDDDALGYVEVHPRVGEAVMSTLAISCAQADGLDIVGDSRSGKLHECLLEKDLESVYEAWLHPEVSTDPPPSATGEELFEFILGFHGDLSKLSAERLRELQKERKPIDDLLGKLREKTSKIPDMDHGSARDDAFRQTAEAAMDEWKRDRNNLSGFFREFFGADAADPFESFFTKVAESTLTGGAAVTTTRALAAGGVATTGGWFGSLATGGIVGAGAGLVIGLVAHAGKTYAGRRQREQTSPYRFLTTLEEAGVVVQSEA